MSLLISDNYFSDNDIKVGDDWTLFIQFIDVKDLIVGT